jgi:hypothetical protein
MKSSFFTSSHRSGLLLMSPDFVPFPLFQGDLVMMMGSAEAIADGPSKPVQFLEDMTDAQKSKMAADVRI